MKKMVIVGLVVGTCLAMDNEEKKDKPSTPAPGTPVMSNMSWEKYLTDTRDASPSMTKRPSRKSVDFTALKDAIENTIHGSEKRSSPLSGSPSKGVTKVALAPSEYMVMMLRQSAQKREEIDQQFRTAYHDADITLDNMVVYRETKNPAEAKAALSVYHQSYYAARDALLARMAKDQPQIASYKLQMEVDNYLEPLRQKYEDLIEVNPEIKALRHKFEEDLKLAKSKTVPSKPSV